MSITLNGQTYRAVLDLAGQPTVIVQSGNLWRAVSDWRKAAVIAGFFSPCVGKRTATII